MRESDRHPDLKPSFVADLPALPLLFAADTLVFSSVAVVSIASLNLSLLVNPVGLYQVGATGRQGCSQHGSGQQSMVHKQAQQQQQCAQDSCTAVQLVMSPLLAPAPQLYGCLQPLCNWHTTGVLAHVSMRKPVVTAALAAKLGMLAVSQVPLAAALHSVWLPCAPCMRSQVPLLGDHQVAQVPQQGTMWPQPCCAGVLQVAKLLVIPFVCMVEAVWFGRRFNTATLLSIMTVIVGVATV